MADVYDCQWVMILLLNPLEFLGLSIRQNEPGAALSLPVGPATM
jgi:hypothetical protein